MKYRTSLLLMVIVLQGMLFNLFGQHSFATPASLAPEASKEANAGQHSQIYQASLLGEAGVNQIVTKWGINFKPRSSRVHPEGELKELKKNKTALKLNSLTADESNAEKKNSASPPIIGSNFEGNWSVVSHPPDNNIAISNGGKIVSVNNDGVEYYDQSGNLLYLDNWSDFINDNSLTSTIYDPVIQYDSQADRFVLAVLHGTSPSTSKVLVLFSKSNDPASGWNYYSLSGNPLNDGSWFDYPKLGISDQEIFICGNLYDNNDNFNQSIIYQVEKSQGYSGSSLNWQYWFNLSATPFPAFTLVPTTYGQQGNVGPGMLFVSTRPGGESKVRLWQITDYINNNPALNSFTANVTTYSPAGDAFMPNTNRVLDNSDCRILHAFYLNDIVHYVFNTDVNQGWNGIHYNRLDIQNLTNQTATLGKAGVEDYSFPVVASFATQVSDPTVMISFLHCSQSVFPSTSVVMCDANMQWSQPTLIKAGTTYIDFLAGNKQRWGDYNGMSRKHNSSTPVVWSATSYATDIVTSSGSLPNTYKTWIAQIQGSSVSTEELENTTPVVSVYPNPVTEKFSIEIDLESREEIRIELVDIHGKTVKVLYQDRPKSTQNKLSFNKAALSSGQYILKVTNQEKLLFNEKIIIQ